MNSKSIENSSSAIVDGEEIVDINELINELKAFGGEDEVSGDVESYNELIENILPLLEKLNDKSVTVKE